MIRKKILLLSTAMLLISCGNGNGSSASLNVPSSTDNSFTSSETVEDSRDVSSFSSRESVDSTASDEFNFEPTQVKITGSETDWHPVVLDAMEEFLGYTIPYPQYTTDYIFYIRNNEFYAYADNETSLVESYSLSLYEDHGYTVGGYDISAGYPTYYFTKKFNETKSIVIQFSDYPGDPSQGYAPSFDVVTWLDDTASLPSNGDGESSSNTGTDMDGDGEPDLEEPIYTDNVFDTFPEDVVDQFYQEYNIKLALPYFESTKYVVTTLANGTYGDMAMLGITCEDDDNSIVDEFELALAAFGWEIRESISDSYRLAMNPNYLSYKTDLMYRSFVGEDGKTKFEFNMFAPISYDPTTSMTYSKEYPTSSVELLTSFCEAPVTKTIPTFEAEVYHIFYEKNGLYGARFMEITTLEGDLIAAKTKSDAYETALVDAGWTITRSSPTVAPYAYDNESGLYIQFYYNQYGSFTTRLLIQ